MTDAQRILYVDKMNGDVQIDSGWSAIEFLDINLTTIHTLLKKIRETRILESIHK